MDLLREGGTEVFAVFPDERDFLQVLEYYNLPSELKEMCSRIFERDGPRFREFIDSRRAYQYILSKLANISGLESEHE